MSTSEQQPESDVRPRLTTLISKANNEFRRFIADKRRLPQSTTDETVTDRDQLIDLYFMALNFQNKQLRDRVDALEEKVKRLSR